MLMAVLSGLAAWTNFHDGTTEAWVFVFVFEVMLCASLCLSWAWFRTTRSSVRSDEL